jgi:drug/metabolite transporter (DMT)-like permease
MTESNRPRARAPITPAGLMFLAITSMGWGINWPINKYLLGQLPPFTLRGVPGMIGAGLLALLALAFRQSLHVPREIWPRLLVAAFFNVAAWMTLMGLALVWLPASEAVLIAYTLPIWASLLAWPVLGERPNLLRVISLAMAFAGLAAILGGHGFAASVEKLPGVLMALGGSIGFAIGTVLTRNIRFTCRRSRLRPGRSGAAAFP